MNTLIEMLGFPFMQRALLAGVVLGALLASLGVLATLRKMAFFGDGVAHASMAGIAIGLAAGVAPVPIALAWAVLIAVLIFYLEKSTRLSSDTLIGILFTTSMSLGIVIISQKSGFQPELLSFLFGSILGIRTLDIAIIGAASTIILAWFAYFLPQLTLLSLSPEIARTKGVKVDALSLSFYIALAVAIILGVKIIGIILVSALLVIPASISRLITGSFNSYLWGSVIAAEIIVIGGLVLSYLSNFPSGATVVLLGGALFFLTYALRIGRA